MRWKKARRARKATPVWFWSPGIGCEGKNVKRRFFFLGVTIRHSRYTLYKKGLCVFYGGCFARLGNFCRLPQVATQFPLDREWELLLFSGSRRRRTKKKKEKTPYLLALLFFFHSLIFSFYFLSQVSSRVRSIVFSFRETRNVVLRSSVISGLVSGVSEGCDLNKPLVAHA